LNDGSMVFDEADGQVKAWRRGKKKQRLSRVKAASVLGVSKKSLDDYMLFLRHARDFGFDFEKNSCEKIGVLRLFVNRARRAQKEAGTVKRRRRVTKEPFLAEFGEPE
jgi:hypothetical protein